MHKCMRKSSDSSGAKHSVFAATKKTQLFFPSVDVSLLRVVVNSDIQRAAFSPVWMRNNSNIGELHKEVFMFCKDSWFCK